MITDGINTTKKKLNKQVECKDMTVPVTFETFYKEFTYFSNLFKTLGSTPKEFNRKMRDPYGYGIIMSGKVPEASIYDTCEDIYKGNSEYDGSFQESFKVNAKTTASFDDYIERGIDVDLIIRLLRNYFLFDPDSFKSIYHMQKNIVAIMDQCLKGGIFRRNQFKAAKKNIYRRRVVPDINSPIKSPEITRILNGPEFPCIVNVMPDSLGIVKRNDIGNFGDGTFIINQDRKVIDCLRINDFWLEDQNLDLRTKFFYRSSLETDPFLVCWNINEVLNAGRELGAPKSRGVLIRSLGENYYKTGWMNWSEKSLILRYVGKNKKPIMKNFNNDIRFFTLKDEPVGEIYDCEKYGHPFMTQFDIDIWKRILEV